ncbi:hypothetical protein GPECTOR_832g64 [Gonium pectorale]|uniref:DNA polymerase zeta catalytic subunit N-terminal domain-containing protein n=1 Tax=Gonium pectorale TaxID=33097 RepID=A0A150FTY5_GONPE|nr:hypothetical protein GPECTOR_832g64 [Gonium pectorale]|eukprot:KXZ41083.1 hypothetical protein GPECTOR_832g64 [Gonium pectorale]
MDVRGRDGASADFNVPFSLRIISIDYQMAPPIPHIDYCFSSLDGSTVSLVPVIRIFGSTPAGQKACVHVHRVGRVGPGIGLDWVAPGAMHPGGGAAGRGQERTAVVR